MIKIEAFNIACPLPVIMVKKELDKNTLESILINVDNEIAVKNLEKLANAYNVEIISREIKGGYEVLFNVNETDLFIENTENKAKMYFISSNRIGSGSLELGETLMNMFLYTLTELEIPPRCLAFMNEGVKLTTTNQETINHLKKLEDAGVIILTCGACLNFYNLENDLKVGEVSNMFYILEEMQKGDVISL